MQRICLLLITLVTGLSAMGNQLNLRRNLCETGQSQSVQYLHSTRNQDVYDAAQRAAHDYPERNLVYAWIATEFQRINIDGEIPDSIERTLEQVVSSLPIAISFHPNTEHAAEKALVHLYDVYGVTDPEVAIVKFSMDMATLYADGTINEEDTIKGFSSLISLYMDLESRGIKQVVTKARNDLARA